MFIDEVYCADCGISSGRHTIDFELTLDKAKVTLREMCEHRYFDAKGKALEADE